MARMTAVAATITSHENVRTIGGRSRRTGVRSVARSRIRSSCAESAFEGAFMALFPEFHFTAKGLQRAMQIDFERALGAPGQRGGVQASAPRARNAAPLRVGAPASLRARGRRCRSRRRERAPVTH